jgi:outer membrane receptor for ferrienterochelin and colicins
VSVEATDDRPRGLRPREAVFGAVVLLGFSAVVLETADDPSTPETEVIRTNRGTTRVVGGEWNFDVRLHELWQLSIGFNVEDARNQDPDPDFGLYRLPRTPIAYGYAEMLGKYEGFEWQIGLNLTGPMLTPRYGPDGQPEVVNRSPWFPDTSVMLAYRVKFARQAYVRPFINLRNVFSAFQTDLPVGPLRDSGYIYGPLAPRSLLAGVSAGF